MKNFKTFLDGLTAAQAKREINALTAEVANGGNSRFAVELRAFALAYSAVHPEVAL